MIELLRRHDRLPASRSATAIGQAAARLLTETVEQLRAPTTATRQQQLPYVILRACFFDHSKRFTAAAQLGMSERQVTRELRRALQLLEAQLGAPTARPSSEPRAEPIPSISGFVARSRLHEQLADMLREHRLVHVHGPRGAGKTSLVAEYVSAAESRPVVWYRLRAGLNTTLPAFLFDLADAIRDRTPTDLVDAVAAAVTANDLGIGSRIMLQALRDQSFLLVVDDYHLNEADGDPRLAKFVEELGLRASRCSVITISRERPRGQPRPGSLDVVPMSMVETQQLLESLRLVVADDLATRVNRWTGGLPQLITLAASWLKTAGAEETSRGLDALIDLDDVQEFLLDSLTDLIDPEDRHVLGAASIFRDRFTDDAVAYVAERSRGQVLDTSRRLIRHYLATRARDGEVAFFHDTVREFVQSRLSPEQRSSFHRRAALWFERTGDPDEAAHHAEQASESVGIPMHPSRVLPE
jgi:ATP/maltotriose-dependent transcriptional regulator MalT